MICLQPRCAGKTTFLTACVLVLLVLAPRAVAQGGTVLAWGNNTFQQCNVPSLPAGLTY